MDVSEPLLAEAGKKIGKGRAFFLRGTPTAFPSGRDPFTGFSGVPSSTTWISTGRFRKSSGS
jgi:hypothetical protein